MSSETVLLDPPSDSAESDEDVTREFRLRGDRSLKLIHRGDDELIEVRAASGMLELRLRMTEDGPVLQMESVRISLKAQESVNVACRSFAVNASESLDLRSDGNIGVRGAADVRVDANGEVRVNGTMIYLN